MYREVFQLQFLYISHFVYSTCFLGNIYISLSSVPLFSTSLSLSVFSCYTIVLLNWLITFIQYGSWIYKFKKINFYSFLCATRKVCFLNPFHLKVLEVMLTGRFPVMYMILQSTFSIYFSFLENDFGGRIAPGVVCIQGSPLIKLDCIYHRRTITELLRVE